MKADKPFYGRRRRTTMRFPAPVAPSYVTNKAALCGHIHQQCEKNQISLHGVRRSVERTLGVRLHGEHSLRIAHKDVTL
jgi:hypothetical protein